MSQFTEAKKTADDVCRTVRALLPKWQAWFPNERSEVEIPRCDLLLLVESAEQRNDLLKACELASVGVPETALDNYILRTLKAAIAKAKAKDTLHGEQGSEMEVPK